MGDLSGSEVATYHLTLSTNIYPAAVQTPVSPVQDSVSFQNIQLWIQLGYFMPPVGGA